MESSFLASTSIAIAISGASMTDFIQALDTDAALQAQYQTNPVATAKSFGLPEQDIELIAQQDWQTIDELFQEKSHSSKSIDHW